MQAIVQTQYGSPEVLHLQEVEKPSPQEHEVLVKIHAAAANPADWHMIRGKPFFIRFTAGFPKPKHPIPGFDFAGIIEAVGSGVTQFKPGDEVFGEVSNGAFADYVCATPDQIVLKPANVSFEQAAAAPMVGFTAIQGLRDTGRIQSGQKVLINGASGGIGTFAVQYAKSVGAQVTGVCSTRNLDLVRSIGADHVVDYTQDDFTKTTYDLIFDTVGNRSAAHYKRALNPNGRCVVAGFTTMPHMLFQIMVLGSLLSATGSRKIGGMGVARPNQQDLLLIKDLLEAGKVVPVIDKTYPLSQTAAAIRHLETGHARGKVIITM
ncbi:MAG TPA: NAD(P)-dependent alcohol dehydrogenase [Aggregatilineaceae bacterium]|nr:NAD(P)-dependent alcohol dehydrogenase [Aggregatilineaceae bacterium]